MASGGSNYPGGGGGGQNSRQQNPVNSSVNRNTAENDCETDYPGPPWLLTANNLSLHTSAPENRLSKKQRNRTKPRLFPITDSSITPESSPQASGGCSKGPDPSKLSPHPPKLPFYPTKKDEDTSRFRRPVEEIEQLASDTGESGNEAIKDLRYTVNQRRQKQNFHNGPLKRLTSDVPQHQTSSKQDNTNKLPDTSVLVERLMHLRDCISQVTSIMQNLEKTDGNQTRSHLGNLDHMLDQLRSEEHENLELLQQVLSFREGAAAAATISNQPKIEEVDSSSYSGGETLEVVQSQTIDNPVVDDERDEDDELDADARIKQNKLMQKMVASQKKLVSLKEQQSALLSMQKKAENRLKEVKAFHERLLESGLNIENGDWIDSGGMAMNGHAAEAEKPLKQTSSSRSVDNSQNHNGTNVTANWDNSNDLDALFVQPVAVVKKNRKPGPINNSNNHTSLENISQQFHSLQQINGHINNGHLSVEDDLPKTDENSETLTDLHRKKLENKLRELQEKKQQMDLLLAELSSLQVTSQPPKELIQLQNKELIQLQTPEAPLKPQANGNLDYHQSGACVQDNMEAGDGSAKMRQLEELKKKLAHLRLLTDNLENGNVNNNSGNADPTLLRTRQQGGGTRRDKSSSTLKSDNLRRDHTSPGFPARRHYEAEGRANEDGDITAPMPLTAIQGGAQAVSPGSSLATLTPAQEQILMEEHAEIEAKVSQLLAAKTKLQQLHGLMGAVHQFKQTGEPLSIEAQQLLSSLHQGFASLTGRASAADPRRIYEDDSSVENAPSLQPAGFDRLTEVEEQLLRQQQELESLTEERKRLLAMQDQLNALHQEQMKQLKNNEQRSSGEGGSQARGRDQGRLPNQNISASLSNLLIAGLSTEARHSRQDNLQRLQSARSSISDSQKPSGSKEVNSKAPNPLNVARNQPNKYNERISEQSLADLNDELNHSLALRDELQHQKMVLQELLRQEHSKQLGFSQNQDLQSQSGSSEKSELVEGSSSVMAPDTTAAATWGGSSTQDNLDDEGEEEPLESLEEQDEDEEGSGNKLSKNSEGRLQTLLQPCIDHQPVQDNESYQRRRNNRSSKTHGSRRGLLNQWRRNFQSTTSNRGKNERQSCYQQPQIESVQPLEQMSLGQAAEAGQASGSSLDGHWRQFTKHIQSQLEQTNLLCQSVLKDQQALSNTLCSFSVNGPAPMPGQSPPSDLMRYYTHLHQQQQLIFSLSHCYHMLYLQQVEIINLQQQLQQQQNRETDVSGISRNTVANPLMNAEEFRAWCLAPPPWVAPLSSPFGPHGAPAPSATPFCFNPLNLATSPFSLNSNSNTLGGITPAQDERGAAETLNNQVPPGTRANNFLDNFRSYSRPNLLSATVAPTKSNESGGTASQTVHHQQQQQQHGGTYHLGTVPQIRPFSLYGSTQIPGTCSMGETAATHRPSLHDTPVVPPFSSGTYSVPTVSGRRSSTPNSSPMAASGGGVRPRTKRPNQNQEQGNGVRRTPGCLNLLTLCDRQPSSSSGVTGVIPPSQNSPNPHNSVTADHMVSIRSTGRDIVPDSSNCDSLRDSIYMEVTSLISNYEQQPDLLQDLLKQLQTLGGTNHPAATVTTTTNITRRKTEGRGKTQSPHTLASLADFSRARLGSDSHSSTLHETVQRDADNLATRLAEHNSIESPIEESSSSTNSWPKGSSATGAIQKKYGRHLNQTPFVPPESNDENNMSSDNLVKQTVLSLVPFLQNHLAEECTTHLQAQLCNHILSALQNLPIHQPLLRFFRSQLLQALQQMLAKYSGRRVRDCEEEMLMEITEVVMKEMAIQKIMQKKKEGRGTQDWSSVSVNRGSNPGANTHGTDFDSPHSNESLFQGSEGFSENEVSNPEDKTESRDWVELKKEEIQQPLDLEYGAQKLTLDLQPDRLDVRAAPDGLAAAPPPPPLAPMVIVHPMSPRLLEEESGYDCDAEGETEPEVEAETDDTKDLAEADQSAGQQIVDRLPHRECLRDRQSIVGSIYGSIQHRDDHQNDQMMNGDDGEGSGAAGSEAMPLGQTSAAEGEGEEQTLDDIPTKLENMSSDELRRHDDGPPGNPFHDNNSSDSSGAEKEK